MAEIPETWCETCEATGYVKCDCGNGICVCDNLGEAPCPECDGEPELDDLDRWALGLASSLGGKP